MKPGSLYEDDVEFLPPERGELPPVVVTDPREFTHAELAVIREALLELARRQEWLSEKPGMPERRRDELVRAADRRFRLARKVAGARLFIKYGPSGERGQDNDNRADTSGRAGGP